MAPAFSAGGPYPGAGYGDGPAAVLQLWSFLVQQQQAVAAAQGLGPAPGFGAGGKPPAVPTEVTAELANASNLPQLLAALSRANPPGARVEDDKPGLRLPAAALRLEANGSLQGAFKEVLRPRSVEADGACSSGKDSKDSQPHGGKASPAAPCVPRPRPRPPRPPPARAWPWRE